jgi:hypothetical protein
MNGVNKMRFLLGAAATGLAIVAGFLLWAQVSAQSASIALGDGSAAPGEEASVDLTANVPDGLGAWTLDISYDADVVTPTDCDGGDANSVCNTEYADGTVRVTGASAQGIDEEVILSTITFSCDDEGDSDLSISVSVLADATIGDPQDITDYDLSDGSITCAVEEPTEEPTQLPPTGSGFGGDSGMSLAWLIAALSLAGVAGVAGLGALGLRNRA